MGRRPIITKQKVAEAALQIIDAEGLEALSVERIAGELGVRGPSLYHHFADKAAMLTEVAGYVLGDLELDRPTETWKEWMVAVGVTFYKRVRQHPRAAAILMEYLPDQASIAGLGRAAKILTEADIDPVTQALLIEGTEKLTWGWSLQRAFVQVDGDHRLAYPGLAKRWPELARAMKARDRKWKNDERMLEQALFAFVNGVVPEA